MRCRRKCRSSCTVRCAQHSLDNNDMATLEAKMSELEQMAQQMASYAYQQQQANPNGGAGQTTSNNNDDNVVDADFEEKN